MIYKNCVLRVVAILNKFINKIFCKNKKKPHHTCDEAYSQISPLRFRDIAEIKKNLQERFKGSADVVIFQFEAFDAYPALIVYIEELIHQDELYRDVLSPLKVEAAGMCKSGSLISMDMIKNKIPTAHMEETQDMNEVISHILYGKCVLFIEGLGSSLIFRLSGWKTRSIEEPTSETVVRGPKEGFIESININRSLIRRKIKNENLVFENIIIGKQTHTVVNIAYITGIVNADVLTEVRRRLQELNIDSVLDAGCIEQYIEDSHISPISTVGNTQKPDIVAAKLLEGRVAILCDGSPHVLTVPYLFIESIQSGEDYYNRPYVATMLRIIRMLALIFSIILPAFYVFLETFHQDLLPTKLFISMVGANIGTPFPSILEALLMVTAFEFLKESGTRMPRAVGPAISIVGALVLGDSAVKAGLVSTDLVVIIAFTAVSTFILPAMNETISLFRMILLFLAGILGLYGVTAGVFVMIFHATSLRSFGIPYLSPFAPMNISEFKDTIVRFPLFSLNKRPQSIAKRNTNRKA